MKKFIRNSLLFLICFLLLERFCFWQTEGFRPSCLANAEVSQESSSVFPTPPRKLYLVGSGTQSFAFSTEEGDYIYKFFKKRSKSSRYFESARLAAQRLLKETGLIALHLHPTEKLFGSVELVDHLNISHLIDLDKTAFVIQKRAVPTLLSLRESLQNQDSDGFNRKIDSLLTLTEETIRKGIKNKDVNLLRNSGFVGDQPIILDIGSLSLRKNSSPHALSKARRKALIQLKKEFPISSFNIEGIKETVYNDRPLE